MIKITSKRASISSEFADAVRSISTAFIAKVKAEIEQLPRMRKTLLEKNRVPLAQHLKALKDPSVIDLELTALRNLPFVKFEVREVPAFEGKDLYDRRFRFPATRYLSGTTADILCKIGDNKVPLIRNIGPYRIDVPLPRLGVGIGDTECQFIPLLNEFTRERFYHHTANWASNGAPTSMFPEHLGASTCWGSFDVISTLNSYVPSRIFKILHQYLSVSNPRSVYVSRLDWAVEVHS